MGEDAETREEALTALAEFRAELAIRHAILGFDMDEEDALELVQNMDINTLTDEEREQRERLIAAISNLIEFSVCAEYHLMKDTEALGNEDTDWSSEDSDWMIPFLALNTKYNDVYMDVENSDIEYCMAMAAMWIKWNKDTTLIYMTQNDDRVRPWHFALQGFTARRDDFPAWMIPPIEWACRCYLISDNNDIEIGGKLDIQKVKGEFLNITSQEPQTPSQLSGVFKESVCKCGRIFSDEHPYFEVDDADVSLLNSVVEKIRRKYYG